jgi:methyltransferase-like protein
MKSAMLHLSQHWPASIPFQSLLETARKNLGQDASSASEHAAQLATRLLNCYTTALIEFSIAAPPFITQVSDRPVASPYARLRARDELKVTNLKLETVALSEPSRQILIHLDGQHDRAALIDLLTQCIKTPPTDSNPVQPEMYLDQLLNAFARSALLIS